MASFELNKAYIEEIKKAIDQANISGIQSLVEGLYAPDIAEILYKIDMDQAKALYQVIGKELAAEVLLELDEETQERFLNELSAEQIAVDLIDNLETDDATDVIQTLSSKKQEEVISHIEDIDHASDIIDLLNYEEGTAGSVMAKELIKVYQTWTSAECIKEIREQAQELDHVYTIYVVDELEKLIGRLSLRRLMMASPRSKVESFLKKDVISANARTDIEEVAATMKKYDLMVIPIVDDLGRLLGRITIDDVMDVIHDEAEKDFQMATGHSSKVENKDSVFILSKARLPWLLIGLMGGIFGARVIGLYEDEIQLYPEMAFFIPLIAAMAGNVGVQSSAIIVQGLANKSLANNKIWARLSKEIGVALINGLVCSLFLLIYNLSFGQNLNLTFTVSIALISVILFAAIFGTLTPLWLDKYKIDPALATGPFITTVNDVLGLLIYFAVGHYMYVNSGF